VPIRVAIVEDDRDFREELAGVIDSTPGLAHAGAFASGEDALKRLAPGSADVVLMDINLPRMSGIQCISELKRAGFGAPITMLTVHEDAESIFQALQAGASGYLLKRTPLEKIIEAIEIAHEGGSPMTPQIARRVVEFFHRRGDIQSELQSLTPRERQVLELLAKGQLYKQLASELDISIDTIRHHIRHIYEKLQVNSRTEAVAKFLRVS
jgi:DNA-binding NarL/FixJ family response regulator